MNNVKIFITILELILCLVFIYILTNYMLFNRYVNSMISRYLNNSVLLFNIFLIIYIFITLLISQKSILSSSILFLIFAIIIKNNINKTIYIENFIESFTNTNVNESNNYIKNEVLSQLKKQVSSDPNITNLEKEVIQDIYDKYFLNSNNLNKLIKFNNEASKYNPVNNKQQIKDILNYYK
jgi:hypothetical protein